MWRDQVKIPAGAIDHQGFRIFFVILEMKFSMIHESQIYAPAGSLIQRRGHGYSIARNNAAFMIALAGIGDMSEVRGHRQVGLQFS